MSTSTSAISLNTFPTFGDLLKYLRRRARLSQRELSIAVGYSESQISRLENNQSAPDPATLAALFVPALLIKDEPETAARLLELAAALRGTPATVAVINGQRAGIAPRRTNLPISLTSFIGREKEIVEVQDLLATHRLTTLTGAGGSGKTRLALEVARTELTAFPNAVWFVELASLSDPVFVAQTIAATLGLSEQSGGLLLTVLTNFLQAKKALLILDNCEHVIDACAQLAETLLCTCPKLLLLVTSREALGVPGEVTFLVPTLSIPDKQGDGALALEMLAGYGAVRLFIERAQSVLPGFQLTAGNAAAVVRICQRLDGIPLALELAAARVKTLRVDEIAARLDDRFRLLTGGSRTALPRHQTLRASMDWSHALLSSPEQVLLRRLSAFAGGWTLEAAEAVCSGDGIERAEVLDGLAQLGNKSIITVEREQGQEARYRLLETIRQYARDKLQEAGEAELVQMRHLDFFRVLALNAQRNYYGFGQMVWMKRLDAERDNLRAALDWATESGEAQAGMQLGAALESYWWNRGLWSEIRGQLERLLARPEAAAPTPARASALNVVGHFAVLLGDFEVGLTMLKEGETISRELVVEGQAALAWALYFLGEAMQARDQAFAWHALDESRALAREIGNTILLEIGLLIQGNIAVRQGNYALARDLYREALVHSLKTGNYWGKGQFTSCLGWIHYVLGDCRAAVPFLREGLAIISDFGDVYNQTWILEELGSIAHLEGDDHQAVILFEESLAIYRTLGRREGIVWLLSNLGIVAEHQGDRARAATFLREALTVGQTLEKETIGLARCLLGLASLDPQPARATQLLAASQTILKASGEAFVPFHRTVQGRVEDVVRGQLGEAAFSQAWAKGRTMTLQQAIAYAQEAS